MPSARAACIRSLILGAVAAALLWAPAAAGAAPLGPAPRAATLQLVVPLVADDAGLAQFARSVSTPGSPQYGQYEPIPMLAQRFGASAVVQSRALAFLRAAGARDVSINPTRMFAEATLTIAAAERAFSTRLDRFSQTGGPPFIAPVSQGRASAAAVGVPAGLRGVATGIVGLDTRRVMPLPKPRAAGIHRNLRRRAHQAAGQPSSAYEPVTGRPAGCRDAVAAGGFTPNQYLSAYGYSPLRAAGLSGRGERVALIEIDGFRYSDIRTFAGCFGLDIPRLSTFYVGSAHALPPGPETTLDLEVLDSVAPDLDAIQIYENSGNAAEVTRSLVLPLITPGAKPQVVSASLGLCEPFMLAAFGRAGINSIERDVELAAATGITVVAASGDQGSAACVNNGSLVDARAVNYPASSQWITAVGGTNVMLNPDNSLSSQVVWNDTTDQLAGGGGGFSDVFGRPAYQARVVGANHRVVPDVAMLADLAPGYTVYCTASDTCLGRDPWQTVGGTSAAAPLLAGGTALVDQDLHNHGRRFLGFMNPLLYAIGIAGGQARGVFSDVTQYSNDVGPYIPGGDGQSLGCCNAGPGFDAASGWGSVNLSAFDRVALQVLPAAPDISIAIPGRQHPIRQRSLKVRLHCSAACTAFAFAVVTIGSGTDFTADTGRHRFARRGTQVLKIRFNGRQLRQMRSGLAHHRAVTAEVFGIEVSADGQVLKFTAGRVTRIRS